MAEGARPPQALESPAETRTSAISVLKYCRVLWWVRGARRWALKTDHWFYGLFQSAPDLIALALAA